MLKVRLPEVPSLKRLVQEGTIAAYRIDDGSVHLLLDLVDGEVVLRYRLTAVREGVAAHPGTTARARYQPSVKPATANGGSLTVFR